MKIAPFILFLAAAFVLRGENLTTRDGKVYQDYKVLSHDTGFITIMYSEGGGKIPLSELPDDLQKKYGYDPGKSAAFVQATIDQDRSDRAAIEAERQAADKQRAAANSSLAGQPSAALQPSVPVRPQTPAAFPPAISTENNSTKTQAAGGSNPMSADDAQAARDKIKELREDIKFMKTQELKNQGTANTTGGYTDKINDEEDQVSQIAIKLTAYEDSMPRLSPGEIADLKQKVRDLKADVALMTRQMPSSSVGAQISSTGAYDVKIEDEQADIEDLMRQLHANHAD